MEEGVETEEGGTGGGGWGGDVGNSNIMLNKFTTPKLISIWQYTDCPRYIISIKGRVIQ
jgi:hypothetical protein